jgi:DNA helicase-2/ATP-dependent DNA helicase PcrA
LFDAIAWAELKPAVRKTLDWFVNLINEAKELSKSMNPAQLASKILEDSGYMTMWRMDKSVESDGRIENIEELKGVLESFASLNEFLDYAALVTDTDDKTNDEELVVMTLHASKGLEFDNVFLPGWEEGVFPHQKALDEAGDEGLEEERRLAYVGLTRARKRAYISYASSRKMYGQWQNPLPSRFVDELPVDHILDCTENAMGRRGAYDRIDRYVADLERKGKTFASFDNWVPNYTPPQKNKRLGKRVFHDSFGYGTVIREEGDRLEVHFDDVGPKKVLSRFLEAV